MSGGFPQFRRNDGGDGPPPKQPEKNEERYEHPDKGQPELHVYEDAHTGEWSAWLNTGIADHDGLCVGHGATRQEAIEDAVGVFEWATDVLQGVPPLRDMNIREAFAGQMTRRLLNALDAGGFTTVKQLTEATRSELYVARGFGIKCFLELRDVLNKAGLPHKLPAKL